ncbi:ROK family protein [Bacillus sp. OTU2372]|uniref:ROK family protein n=1 Tax=Bacillus sp. OTU2372 TaxID=3043858 RepID=UPI00313DF414
MYLVIDIGGTFAKYALMDAAANIVIKGKRLTPRTNVTDFENVIFSIIEEHVLSDIKGIAISCPGTIDVDTGMIYFGGSFPFLHEVNLKNKIEKKYGKEVFIENDAKCAALAELWLGSVKGTKNSVVLVLGSAVGAGIIIDGKLHRGVHLSAGEVSYILNQINPQTRAAEYFGLICSAVDMVRRIAEIKKLEDSTDGEQVFKYINNNDVEANAIFNEYCINLAAQILNLHYILDPEVFAIGGGISVQPILLERIQWAINEIKNANPLHTANPKVIACKFHNDANLYRALYHFFVSKENTFSLSHL